LFIVITKLSYGKKQLAYLQAHKTELETKIKIESKTQVDPVLDYEIRKSHQENEQIKPEE